MDRKAQGLSLNTIIIAIIVLVVLVIVVMIFTGYFGNQFVPGINSCTAKGGECKANCDSPADEIQNVKGCSAGQACCQKVKFG